MCLDEKSKNSVFGAKCADLAGFGAADAAREEEAVEMRAADVAVLDRPRRQEQPREVLFAQNPTTADP
jgi:hypothetical protein